MKRMLDGETPWPPCEAETLWGELTGPRIVKVLNSPFFATNVSYLDEVLVSEAELPAGMDRADAGPNFFEFDSIVSRSGRGTVRAILKLEEGREVAEAAVSAIEQLGCTWESADEPGFPLLSIDIPEGVAQGQVMEILQNAMDAGAIYLDVGFLPERRNAD